MKVSAKMALLTSKKLRRKNALRLPSSFVRKSAAHFDFFRAGNNIERTRRQSVDRAEESKRPLRLVMGSTPRASDVPRSSRGSLEVMEDDGRE